MTNPNPLTDAARQITFNRDVETITRNLSADLAKLEAKHAALDAAICTLAVVDEDTLASTIAVRITQIESMLDIARLAANVEIERVDPTHKNTRLAFRIQLEDFAIGWVTLVTDADDRERTFRAVTPNGTFVPSRSSAEAVKHLVCAAKASELID